ncbi:MAG: 5'-3' exonuclease [Mycoplasma sp.]|nr:5'-3' exonuclease [Candidatus Hennigella equi]
MKKAMVIDGNSLIYRVYWATFKMLPYFKQHNLIPTNAVNLFTKAVLTLLQRDNYDYCFVAFDHAKHTFRSEMLDQYKANRKPMPTELFVQLPMVHSFLDAMGIKHESKEGFEADDLIGSYCKLMNDNQIQVDVFSSDKDMLQLVNELTSVNLFKVGVSETVRYEPSNFPNLYFGLQPTQVVDYKAIVGDGSDNFPGIKGLGPKTAAELLKKFGSFANIYQNLSQLSSTQAQKFIDNKANGELCYQIATIEKDLFVDKQIDEFIKKEFNKEQFIKLVNDYKLPSLLKFVK